MKKADKINLAIGNCFAKVELSEEECLVLQDISVLELITKHGLNEDQANLVKSWCKRSQQKMSHLFDKEEEDELKSLKDIYDTNFFERQNE